MKIYNVVHVYDKEGGFGDAVRTEEFVAAFENAEDAQAFVEKYSKPYVYDRDRSYVDLYCNQFAIVETEIITHAEFDINKTPKEYGVFIPCEMSFDDSDDLCDLYFESEEAL